MALSNLNRIKKLEERLSIKSIRHIDMDGYEFLVNDGLKNKYKPTPTGKKFHESDDFIRLIIGPYGSGKSTACCAEIVRRACEMPKWANGVRRSKWAVVRNTSGELESTTLQTWLQWFGQLGSVTRRKKPILTLEHQFNDGEGVVEIELLFLALDREADLGKIRSLELTGVYLNELSEIPEGALTHFKGRVNRYPAIRQCDIPYWSGIICDTNPPDIDHWIYRDFEKQSTEGYQVFHQPPGLIKDENGNYIANPDADNYNNLRNDYYTNMARGAKEEFIKVFCLGEYGAVILGNPVYPEYNDDFHGVASLEPIVDVPIHLGFDFGLTPACIIVQLSPSGQLRILKELVSTRMGIRQFVENVVKPYLSKHFALFEIESVIGDPAGNAKVDTDESTCIDVLCEYGFPATGASSNSLVKRIGAVQYFLNRMVDGQPALQISKENCPALRKGFLGNYHYKRLAVTGEARYHDKPNKNEASHPHDALQYIAMSFVEDLLFNDIDDDVYENMRVSALRI